MRQDKTMDKLNNKRGVIILGYIIVAPFLLFFFLYIVLGGAFYMQNNHMTNITNLTLDRVLVQGEFTSDSLDDLKNDLIKAGFEEEHLRIEVEPGIDVPVQRGETMTLTVIHETPHAFYWVNRFFVWNVDPSIFHIGVKIEGMSEKWH